MDVAGGVSFGFTGLLFRSVERLCEGEPCCLGHRTKVSVLCLLYKIYHRVDHSANKYLNQFVAAHNTRASAALGFTTVTKCARCRTDQFNRSFLPAAGVYGSCCCRARLVVAP